MLPIKPTITGDATPKDVHDPSAVEPPYASRGGLKLHRAIAGFGLDPVGAACVDLGCSTGGFVDCWLRHGARRVYAVDTAYGELAWKLRQDDRVCVMERTNALHAPVPDDIQSGQERIGFISIDLGWTRQAKALPAAARWCASTDGVRTRVVTLVKPHYEIDKAEFREHAVNGVLPDDLATTIAERVIAEIPGMAQAGPPRAGECSNASGLRVVDAMVSPIRGGKKANSGNLEWLVLVEA